MLDNGVVNKSKVTRAVIPAAGLGTRFLPATKTIPKEMLTIVDAPIIFYVVEEAIKAGIEDIILIQGRHKESIEDFFDTTYELEDKLEKSKKFDLLDRLLKIRNMANLISVRQKQPLGLGHAVWCSKRIVGDNPFAVLLGDEIMIADPGQQTAVETLCQRFDETQKSTVAVMQVPSKEVSKYGVADVQELSTGYFRVKGFVEKPKPENAPSRWALPGRYVFTPQIFDYLTNAKPGLNGEIQLTDSMNELAKADAVFASDFNCTRYDAGDKLGYLTANIEVALRNNELKTELKDYLIQLGQQLSKGLSAEGAVHSPKNKILTMFLVFLLPILFHASIAMAFIPKAKFILDKTVENNGSGYYQIEQEVTFTKEQEQLTLKETWMVESDESMKLLVQGPKDNKDLLQMNLVFKQDQRLGADLGIHASKKIDAEMFERWFHFRNTERFSKQLVEAKMISADVFTPASIKTLKDINNDPDHNVRLSRTSGTIAYAIGAPTTASQEMPNPGLWIEQDFFLIRKLRLPSTAEITAEKYSPFARGLSFPRHRTVKWGPQTVTITVLSVVGRNKDSWNQFPTKLALKKDKLKESPFAPIVEDFYERFR
jgi:UTP--glucose-1-phosphate uridylyltransferase